uniref:Xanthine dehydrogenase accessory factor n=1 Tax=Candidatus Kentrum sp. FW TaxID=2126338 RepID=A0A450SUT8_9GAMM|nr:MAG: xanthine dehydrogenase accessory factor [Candidatus Kentron sp. FW]
MTTEILDRFVRDFPAKRLWESVHDCLEKDVPVSLLIVVESDGSAPGRAGFKMAVTTEGRLVGTIGGGIVEQELVGKAREQWGGDDPRCLLERRRYDGAMEDDSVCGGRQTIALYPCRRTDSIVVGRLMELFENREKGILRLSPSGILLVPGGHNPEHCRFESASENEWVYEENVGFVDTVYIIGGGHVGVALSRVLAMLGFYVVILDERSDTPVSGDWAHERIVVSYGEIGGHIPDGRGNYAVIMTTNHRADRLVLEQLLNRKLSYLGMMGSRRKVDEVFRELRNQGASQMVLQGIHAPIGVPIKSHTPAEIAISIAAEIVGTKNGWRNGAGGWDRG